MPTALTPNQLEILRRMRDDQTLLAGDPIPGAARELGFLLLIGLLVYGESSVLELSELGAAYLGAAEAEAAAKAAGAEGCDGPEHPVP